MRTTSVLHVRTPGGLEIHLDDAAGRVTISGQGSTIRIDSTGVTIDAAAQVHVNASQVSVSAGLLNVDAGMAKFSSLPLTLTCDALTCTWAAASIVTPVESMRIVEPWPEMVTRPAASSRWTSSPPGVRTCRTLVVRMGLLLALAGGGRQPMSAAARLPGAGSRSMRSVANGLPSSSSRPPKLVLWASEPSEGGRYPRRRAANVRPSMLNERLFAAASGASGWARLPTIAADAMVATSHPLATRAGVRALEAGGNAVDAALAAAANADRLRTAPQRRRRRRLRGAVARRRAARPQRLWAGACAHRRADRRPRRASLGDGARRRARVVRRGRALRAARARRRPALRDRRGAQRRGGHGADRRALARGAGAGAVAGAAARPWRYRLPDLAATLGGDRRSRTRRDLPRADRRRHRRGVLALRGRPRRAPLRVGDAGNQALRQAHLAGRRRPAARRARSARSRHAGRCRPPRRRASSRRRHSRGERERARSSGSAANCAARVQAQPGRERPGRHRPCHGTRAAALFRRLRRIRRGERPDWQRRM